MSKPINLFNMKTLYKLSLLFGASIFLLIYLLVGSLLISFVFSITFTILQFIMLHFLIGIIVVVLKPFFRN